MKRFNKSTIYLHSIRIISAIAVLFIAASCSSGNVNEPTELNQSIIMKKVKKYLKEKQISPRYAIIQVGTFTCKEKEYKTYLKLQAAGVVTLDIIEDNGRYKTISASLTDKTQKYTLKELPKPNPKDPDMVQPETGDFPEFQIKDDSDTDSKSTEEEPQTYDWIYTEGTEYSVYKIRNIKIDSDDKYEASFQCILQCGHVTPAYRVLAQYYDNTKILVYGEVRYYLDKGWTITSFDTD